MNVAQLLERSAQLHADRPALIFGERRWTYAELDGEASALAAGLAGLDLHRGERVALHLPNRPDFVLAYYAALKAGLVPLSLNTSYKADELEYIIANAAVMTGTRPRNPVKADFILATYMYRPIGSPPPPKAAGTK